MSWVHSCKYLFCVFFSAVIFIGCRYHTDPSGTFVRYDAKAIGSGSEAAQSELQDKWYKVCHDSLYLCKLNITEHPFQQMTLREAQILTLRVLKQVMEEKLDQHNVQLAQVRPFHILKSCIEQLRFAGYATGWI